MFIGKREEGSQEMVGFYFPESLFSYKTNPLNNIIMMVVLQARLELAQPYGQGIFLPHYVTIANFFRRLATN
jgi:hypothetical protein